MYSTILTHSVVYDIQVESPGVSCQVQWLNVSTRIYPSGDKGAFPIKNSSVQLADGGSIKEEVAGLLPRKKYHSVFSITDNNTGAVVDKNITDFSK